MRLPFLGFGLGKSDRHVPANTETGTLPSAHTNIDVVAPHETAGVIGYSPSVSRHVDAGTKRYHGFIHSNAWEGHRAPRGGPDGVIAGPAVEGDADG